MALDKVIDSVQLDADLTAVADAIRTKGGTTDPLIFPEGFVSAVEGIQTGAKTEDAVFKVTTTGTFARYFHHIKTEDDKVTYITGGTISGGGTVDNECKTGDMFIVRATGDTTNSSSTCENTRSFSSKGCKVHQLGYPTSTWTNNGGSYIYKYTYQHILVVIVTEKDAELIISNVS